MLVAGVTIRWRVGIAAGVTGDTFKREMRSGQRELSLIMIKRGWRPGIGIMTLSTIQIKAVGCMIRIRCGIVILLVAGKTIAGCVGIPGGVTIDTLEGNVRTG